MTPPGGEPTVVLVGAWDTKAQPLARLHRALVREGCRVHRVDYGTDSRDDGVETTSTELAHRAGIDLDRAHEAGRADTLETMGRAVAGLLTDLHAQGGIDALVLTGGSGAATVFAAAAPSLPFGVPKVLVSTIVAGDTRPYLQGLDALLFFPVVDVEGDNHLLRSVLDRAAAATAATARQHHAARSGVVAGETTRSAAVGMTMFGITTPCVTAVRRLLEQRGHEVLVFHANGTGGAALERAIRRGDVGAVVDVTTTELADLVAGGTLSAGSDRLTAAGERQVPQVVVPGALDTVNFGPPETVPERHRSRLLHRHNPHVTLMRTDAAEARALGELVAERAGASPSTTTVVLPLGGVSELDRDGGAFWDPAADAAFRDALRAAVDPGVRLVESPHHVNDPAFAELLVAELDLLGGLP